MTHYGVRRPFATRGVTTTNTVTSNNVVYYEAMDTAINAWMIGTGDLDPATSPAIALCAESGCVYRASASFPEPLEVGIGIEKLGGSSVIWALGIFRPGEDEPIATGRFVHVFVDAATRRPTPVPAGIRSAIERELMA